jgi:colanic acid/amylovoran biosynthesis glycosyltransferase
VRVAYFTNNYPGFSHTFIRREIRAIEALGVSVFRCALRPAMSLVNREDQEEERQTRYIVRAGAGEMVRGWVAMLLTRPLGIGQAIRQALNIGWHSDRGILRHLVVYLPEAAILAYWCRRNGIQHLHAHFGTNPAAIAMLASRISGIPYSFTVHGPEEFDKWPFLGLAVKIRHSMFVVAVSSYGRSQLYRCVEHAHWNKVQVVHCGLEPAVFAAAKTPATAARRLVCIGRLSEQKGHLLLVEAAHRLANQGVDFELVLIGDGHIRPDIEALVQRHNLQARVRITGWLDDRQVREEILAARALVLPSFAEGLPVVIMEAMALRRPVISTFVAGIPELVHTGEHGWLVPAGDVEALVDAMRDCLDTPVETLARMGEAAQKRALLRHSVDVEAAKLVKLFEAGIIERRECHEAAPLTADDIDGPGLDLNPGST